MERHALEVGGGLPWLTVRSITGHAYFARAEGGFCMQLVYFAVGEVMQVTVLGAPSHVRPCYWETVIIYSR